MAYDEALEEVDALTRRDGRYAAAYDRSRLRIVPVGAPTAAEPEEVQKDDEGRPYPCGAFISDDSRWFCRLASDHDGDHEWVQPFAGKPAYTSAGELITAAEPEREALREALEHIAAFPRDGEHWQGGCFQIREIARRALATPEARAPAWDTDKYPGVEEVRAPREESEER
jgi:hypothetical protein